MLTRRGFPISEMNKGNPSSSTSLLIVENRRLCTCDAAALWRKHYWLYWKSSWSLCTNIEEIDDESVIKLSVWKKKEFENRRLAFGIFLGVYREKTNREKTLIYYGLARDVINYFIVPFCLEIGTLYTWYL